MSELPFGERRNKVRGGLVSKEIRWTERQDLQTQVIAEQQRGESCV